MRSEREEGDWEKGRRLIDELVNPLLHSLIQYCKSTRDYLVPSVWGPVEKKDDPYAPTSAGCTCSIM